MYNLHRLVSPMIIDNINIISQENKFCDKRDINDDPQYALAAIEDEIVYSLYGATTPFLHGGNKIFHIRHNSRFIILTTSFDQSQFS